MESRRKLIREAVKGILKGKTAAGDKVYSNLSSPTWRQQLPAIVIYSRSEAVETFNVAPKEYKHTLQLAIEAIAYGNEDPAAKDLLEDLLDQIGEDITREMHRDETLGETINVFGKKTALIDSMDLRSMEFQFEGDGARPTGSLTLVFDLVYYEMRPASMEEQAGISDLETINAKWKVGHHDSAPDNIVEAEDNLENLN